MYAFLIFFLMPLAVFASEFDDFVSRRVGECILEMYELRNEEPRNSVTYQYLCGRLDSYYDVLYKIEQPDRVHQFDREHSLHLRSCY